MNIFVCIKQVPDTEASLTVKDGNSINDANIKWIISPHDEFAIEEALKLQEKIIDSSVTVLTLGPQRAESVLRSGLAMGAQKATHIEVNEEIDHLVTARAIAEALKKEGDFGVIFLGKQAIDDDAYLVHIYLAEFLGIPVATNVLAFNHDEDKVLVEREIDEGSREKIEMSIPCVVGAAKGLNTPRYPSLMGMMKAKKIAINKLSLEDLAITGQENKIVCDRLYSPPEKPPGKVLQGEIEDSVKELVQLLKQEAKVL